MHKSATPTRKKEVRILIADADPIQPEKLQDFLTNNGFQSRVVRSGLDAQSVLLNWKPDFILMDLMLPDMNAIELLHYLNSQDLLGENKIKVIVCSKHNHADNVRECFRLGASELMVKPYKYVDLLLRLVFHLQPKKTLDEKDTPIKDAESLNYMHLLDVMLKEAAKGEALSPTIHRLTTMVALATKAVRVSLLSTHLDSRRAKILAANDLKEGASLQLDLNKYPEVLWVLNSKKLLVLENLTNDPVMRRIVEQNKTIGFNSMVIAPVFAGSQLIGVLSCRMPESKQSFSESELRFIQLSASTLSLLLSAKSKDAAELLTFTDSVAA